MSIVNRRTIGGSLQPVHLIKNDSQGGTIDNSMFVRFGDSPSVDAFARLRVSQPATLFDSQFQYDKDSLIWDEAITGSATSTHLPNESTVRMRATNSERIIRQTKQYYHYQPGKSQLILCTFSQLHSSEADAIKLVGYGDNNNGVFLKSEGGVNFITLRSFISGSAVDTDVSQSDWNLDKFDGTGASGITIDLDKAQVLIIDLEWLGVGRVRVGFIIDGVIYYAHQLNNANIDTTVYMTTANLPIRYEVDCRDYAGGSNIDLKQICSQVATEGGFVTETGIPFSAGNAGTTISVTTRRPICSIRPKTAFNSITNKIMIFLGGVEGYSATETVFFEVIFGGTLTNASFSDVSNDSSIEVDVSATAISDGVVVQSFYIPAVSQGSNISPSQNAKSILSRIPLALDISGAHPTSPFTDSLSVVATSIAAGNPATETAANISWIEIR